MKRDVFIVSTARTPVGKRNGYLHGWIVPELLGFVLDTVVSRIDLDPALIEDVLTGCVYQIGEQGYTLARTGVFASHLPDHVPGVTLNRQCGSSLTALTMAYALIAVGIHDIVIASGCEVMSKYTLGSEMDGTMFNGKQMGNVYQDYYLRRVKGQLLNQLQAAEAIAKEYNITEEECQEFALASHMKAHYATEHGYFKKEIIPTRGLDKEGNEIVQDKDETIRPDTTLEKIKKLEPIEGVKWLTAGVSSTISDGASAVILMSEEKVKQFNLSPIARVAYCGVIGSDPRLLLTGPVAIWPKMVKKSGLDKNDIDIFEVNEAFAPIPLAWVKTFDIDLDRVNVNGGAIALGHPVGNSGTRLSITAMHELQRRKARYGYVTLCTGAAMGPAVIFESA